MVYAMTTKMGNDVGHLYYIVQIASMSSGGISVDKTFRTLLAYVHRPASVSLNRRVVTFLQVCSSQKHHVRQPITELLLWTP